MVVFSKKYFEYSNSATSNTGVNPKHCMKNLLFFSSYFTAPMNLYQHSKFKVVRSNVWSYILSGRTQMTTDIVKHIERVTCPILDAEDGSNNVRTHSTNPKRPRTSLWRFLNDSKNSCIECNQIDFARSSLSRIRTELQLTLYLQKKCAAPWNKGMVNYLNTEYTEMSALWSRIFHKDSVDGSGFWSNGFQFLDYSGESPIRLNLRCEDQRGQRFSFIPHHGEILLFAWNPWFQTCCSLKFRCVKRWNQGTFGWWLCTRTWGWNLMHCAILDGRSGVIPEPNSEWMLI